MKKVLLNEAMHHCYRELYKNATPSADFDQLVENAPLNELGQKEIDFMAYEIEQDVMEDIISKTLTKFKIKSPYLIRAFKNRIYLGVSPKYKPKTSTDEKS